MTRINLALVAAVLASAFYLVHTQYESRRLYTAIDRANMQTQRLNVEHEQLQVLQREQAKPARVEQLASRKLRMRSVGPGITEYVAVSAEGAPQPLAPGATR